MSIKHSSEELTVIEEFVRNNRDRVTVDTLGQFIHERFDQLWNVQDKTTNKYLQGLIQDSLKRRKIHA